MIVALNGTEPESASLDYGTGTVKASEISGNHLVFLVPGADYGEKSESLIIEKNSEKETIRLTSFFQASGTEKLDPEREISDSGIASGRSRAAGGITEAQEASVGSLYRREQCRRDHFHTGSSLCSGRNFSFPLRHEQQHCSGAGSGPRRKRGRSKPDLERRPL